MSIAKTGKNNPMYGKTPTNTKRIRVTSTKTKDFSFLVKSSYEAEYVDLLNNDDSVKSFEYEPRSFRVKYKDKNNISRTYMPDFLVNDKVIEIKNSWNIKLPDVNEKKEAFNKAFPNTEYQIIALH